MADRKSQQKYYPPDWVPEHGSLNTYHGSHPLRERARKLHEGIMIVRFELPFNIWCAGCGNHVGMGVRYNAEKMTVGNYYSTPIFKFRMKCHLCDNKFEIQTDPKNFDYVVVSGASKQDNVAKPKEGEMLSVEGESEAERLAKDPMYRLEHGVRDVQKAKESVPQIAAIQKMQESKKDDFSLNQLARKRFRDEKAVIKADTDERQAFADRLGLSIPVAKEAESDVALAKRTTFHRTAPTPPSVKRREVRAQPILPSAPDVDKRRRSLLALRSTLGVGSGSTTSSGEVGGVGSGINQRRAQLGVLTRSQTSKGTTAS